MQFNRHNRGMESGSSGGQQYPHEEHEANQNEESLKYQEVVSEDEQAVDLEGISNRDLEEKIRQMKLQIRSMQGTEEDLPIQEEVLNLPDPKNQLDDSSSDFDDGRNLHKLEGEVEMENFVPETSNQTMVEQFEESSQTNPMHGHVLRDRTAQQLSMSLPGGEDLSSVN